MYKTEDYQNYHEKLQTIKQFGWVKNHLHLKEMPNFWTILEFGEKKEYGKRSAHEIRTSRMIRWLVDANETHQLGNVFAHEMMQFIGVDYAYNPNENKRISATAEDMDIDVFYKDYSKKICLAIELKQYAKEGTYEDDTSQLDKYKTLVEELIKDADQTMQPYYIYLTPQKDDSSNPNWHPMGYQELIDIIDTVLDKHVAESTYIYATDTKKILTDFKHDLQRSIDYSSRKNNEINSMLSDEEKKLTSILAEEIEHETDAKHLEELMAIDQDELLELQDLILITNQYVYAQDHSPNDRIRLLIRMIYNYLSDDKQLDTVNLVNDKNGKKSLTRIKQHIIEQYGLTVDRVQITSGKGQGLYLRDKDDAFQIYLSGDTRGDFPNDYIHLIPIPNHDKKRLDATYVPNRKFNLNSSFIEDNLIRYKKEDRTITFEAFMLEHVMLAVKELNDKGIASL